MPSAARSSVIVVVAALLLSGCRVPVTALAGDPTSPSPHAVDTHSTGPRPAIAVGVGPQSHYTIQQQPAPGSCHYRYDHGQPLEDPACTPGAISPAVTQANLNTTICRSGGYTSGIRPSSYVTGKEKALNAVSYGYTGSMRDAEYDHLISLQLGGDPNDPRNLWVEPPSPGHAKNAGPNNPKDAVETELHTAVCNGTITLAQAQQAIVTDWFTAMDALHLP
jgi:hypothetical protein